MPHRRGRRRGETCVLLPSFVAPRSSDTVRSPVSSPGMKSGSVSPVKPFPGAAEKFVDRRLPNVLDFLEAAAGAGGSPPAGADAPSSPSKTKKGARMFEC